MQGPKIFQNVTNITEYHSNFMVSERLTEKELAKSDRDRTSKRAANLEFIDLTGPQ